MEIKLSEISFIEQLKESESSCVFRVHWHDKDCVMKVYHAWDPSPADPSFRELDPFKCESHAYHRLKSAGLCDRGYVPKFYGFIEDIDPGEWEPHLESFRGDNLRPNAVLMEYVPDMRTIDLSNFSHERIHQLRRVLAEMHAAGVYHADAYPQNMKVQENSGRVLWIGFDHAQTFSTESITALQQKWLDEEMELMDYFVGALTADFRDGEINRTWMYYNGSV
ncbi:hypothetical protein MPDQ_000908 [Monascus purpureus]|uniref:Protein kinase domain-containing protein n=1 Tax=Monascus purpureus TaxID=5098 RepID=A0A507QSW2_MONPU|nr:hypothetical protein MPDQ_000908 [Monascus purpureus]BDD62575.1 hypothetical protein MAP00_007543 [Monascus purpureus]